MNLLTRVAFIAILVASVMVPRTVFADSAQYFYDAGGRLSAVLDPVNGSAQYNYDKSGNITSIVRNPLTTLTVLAASPNPVAIGSVITIAGTAFGTVANTSVSFNGTTATPSSVTSTSITVTIPSGATSGLISVTSPAGTASARISEVIGLVPAASITSFTTGTATPTTAAIGDTLTVSGTNFDTSVSKALVNGQFSQITTATSTSIVLKVPQSASGKVEVETPAGSAFSSGDLYVAPTGYTVSQVNGVMRTTIGASPVTVTDGGAGTVSLVLFDATAGQRFTAHLNFTGVSGCPFTGLLLPNGIPAYPAATQCASDLYLGAFPVAQSGTFSLEMAPSGTAGTYQAQISNVPADATVSATIGGSLVSVATTAPGQNATITFSGTAGQKFSLFLGFSALPGCANYSIVAPDGSYYINPSFSCSADNWPAGPAVLPQTGLYTVKLAPVVGVIGTISAQLYSVPADPSASASIGGSTQTISLTAPGQHGVFTFSGTTGQRISMNLDLHALNTGCTTYTVQNPDGSNFIAPTLICATSSFYPGNAAMILPQTGTYSIILVPSLGDANTGFGGLSTTLFSVPTDVTAAATVGGSSVYETITAPGQLAFFTFSGTSGHNYTTNIDLSGLTTTSCSTMSVYNPDGSTLLSPTLSCGGSYSTGSLAVSQTGTFKVKVVPNLSGSLTAGTGSVGAGVTSP